MITEGRQLLVFMLDGRRIALRLACVERVERVVAISPLPRAPENVLGIINVRGQIVPIFNVRKGFQLPGRDVDPSDRLILAHTARRRMGLVVDAVAAVIDGGNDEITAGAEILPGLEHVEGVAKLEDGIVMIHDLNRFLSLREETALDEALNRG